MNKTLTYCTIIYSFLLAGCISRECKDAEDLDLQVFVNYSPTLDTFQLGDELLIESSFSDILRDPDYDTEVELENFDFFTTIAFQLTNMDTLVEMDFSDLEVKESDVSYELRGNSNGSIGVYIESHNYMEEYSFNFKVKLNRSGLYSISTISLLGKTNATSQQSYPGQCWNQELQAEYKANNGNAIENNIDLLHSSSLYEDLTEGTFNRNGGFAFYVKE